MRFFCIYSSYPASTLIQHNMILYNFSNAIQCTPISQNIQTTSLQFNVVAEHLRHDLRTLFQTNEPPNDRIMSGWTHRIGQPSNWIWIWGISRPGQDLKLNGLCPRQFLGSCCGVAAPIVRQRSHILRVCRCCRCVYS